MPWCPSIRERRRSRAVEALVTLEWHKIPVQKVLTLLSVSRETGLSGDQVVNGVQRYGKNIITPPKTSTFRKLVGWVFGGFGTILLAASIICVINWKPIGNRLPDSSSNLVLAIVLLIVVLIQAIFNAWQDFSSSRAMAALKSMLPSDVSVLRDSVPRNVPAEELVPGDLVTVTMGDRVPADMRLIEVSADLQFDRSVLTGEVNAVSGTVDMTDENYLQTKNLALQGTHCISGSGLGVVIQTGDTTAFGIIAKLVSTEHTKTTTLQRELRLFAIFVVAGAILAAVVTAVLMIVLWAAWLRRSQQNIPQFLVNDLLSIVIAIMVASLPEGLPIAVTLSLAKAANDMRKKEILCKSLSIVETLGSVNVLCSDKTGTLTQNIMEVDNVAIFDTDFDLQSVRPQEATPDTMKNLAAIGAICNAATFVHNVPASDPNQSREKRTSGNPTDGAILRFSDSVTSADITRKRWMHVYRINFNPKTKFMLELSQLSPEISLDDPLPPLTPWDNYTHDCFLLSVKGAPEVLLPRCSYVLDPSGSQPRSISSIIRKSIIDTQERWSLAGQRVLLLARRIIHDERFSTAASRQSKEFARVVEEELNRDLIIVGLIGLTNPLKPDITRTVSVCRSAGIRFFIITGDHPATALTIARQAGIITSTSDVHKVADLGSKSEGIDKEELKSIVITGQELVDLTPPQRERLCRYEEIVFARADPQQKLQIVREFKNRGDIVAVTGDGVNDGPSLKAADVGVAMGAGSDVAKEAADLILVDDFSSILGAIAYGRLVYDNLKKTCIFLFPAGCFAQIMPILLTVILGIPLMLGNFQMLIICVGTDILPALSLCLEKPEADLMLRPPRDVKKDRLINWRFFLQAYGFVGVIECLCASAMAYWYLQEKGFPFSSFLFEYDFLPGLTIEILSEAWSVYFFTLIIMQLGNLFATRCRRLSMFQHSPTKNIYVFIALIISLCIGIFFCYVPAVQPVLHTHGIPAKFFFIPATFALALLILDELRKLVVRTHPKSILARVAW